MLRSARFLTPILFLVIFPFFVSAATCPADEERAIRKLIDRFICSFNDRDTESMLELYAEDAKISTDFEGDRRVVSKSQYQALLDKRMRGPMWGSVTITGYEIEDLVFKRNTISFKIVFIGKLSFFTGKSVYEVTAEKSENKWKVVREKNL